MSNIRPPVYDFTDEELKRIDASWKSDVDFKLDALLEFHSKYSPLLVMLTEREQDRRALRKAIIEKSLAGLVYTMVGTALILMVTGLKTEFMILYEAAKNLKK